jgi:hypothetical protein
VTTPTGFRLRRFSTTGISPQLLSLIILATSLRLVFGSQVAGLAVMKSLAFISASRGEPSLRSISV